MERSDEETPNFIMIKMRLLQIIFIFVVLIAQGCMSDKKENKNSAPVYYIENTLSFFDPYEAYYADGKYQGHIYENWLRRPENLRMIHETFKKVGYDNLISEYDLKSNPTMLWGYVKRPLDQIIDSLIKTYPLDTIKTRYYREFWQRRIKEENAQEVYEILLEIDSILLKKREVKFNNSLVNDTLYNLVLISYKRQKPSREQARKDFEYLKSIGMLGSAYNLLYENYSYQDVDWDRESLVKELEKDSTRCCPYPWVMDTTK